MDGQKPLPAPPETATVVDGPSTPTAGLSSAPPENRGQRFLTITVAIAAVIQAGAGVATWRLGKETAELQAELASVDVKILSLRICPFDDPLTTYDYALGLVDVANFGHLPTSVVLAFSGLAGAGNFSPLDAYPRNTPSTRNLGASVPGAPVGGGQLLTFAFAFREPVGQVLNLSQVRVELAGVHPSHDYQSVGVPNTKLRDHDLGNSANLGNAGHCYG